MTTTHWPDAGRVRRIMFRICVGLPALALAVLGGRLAVIGWFDPAHAGSRRVPAIAWGALEGVLLLVPLTLLLFRPAGQVAALRQTLAVGAALLATMALTGPDPATLVLIALVVTGYLLHPDRPAVWPAGRLSKSRGLLALVIGIPLIAVATHFAAQQRTAVDVHASTEDYGGLTAWALATAATLAVAAFGTRWRIPAFLAGVSVAMVGLASLLPSTSGALLSRAAGLLLLAGAGVTVAVAALTRRGTPADRQTSTSTDPADVPATKAE